MSDPRIYTVGWICAIATEYLAAQLFLDEEHDPPESVSVNDSNDYTLGRIGRHNVVIAVLPLGEYGISSATGVAKDMLHSFPNVRIGLMVGIGGGAPTSKHDIRLGDVVVGISSNGEGAVFQYDFGKTLQGQEFQTMGFLNQPPTVIRTAVHGLLTDYKRKGHQLNTHINDILEENPRLRKDLQRPEPSTDRLYDASKVHPKDDESNCAKVCGNDPSTLVPRPDRGEYEDDPTIHYGLIASSNSLMKDALARDALAAKKGVLCFEMEAAGLMNHFPFLVVRGICDYSDSHKNKECQGFAAMMAAAYAKDLLKQIPLNKVEAEKPINEILSSIECTGNETKKAVSNLASDNRFTKIKEWLSPSDFSTNANMARQRRHPGTGSWLLKSSTFQEWKLGSRRHLWLYALAGCGKTILSGTILDHLQKSANNYTTIAFFFDFNDSRKQKLEDLVRSLAVQLYHASSEAAETLDRLFTFHSKGCIQPRTDALSNWVSEMITATGNVFIIVDALDECTTRDELLHWIRDLTRNNNKAQTLLTGRPEAEFQHEIPSLIDQDNCILLDERNVNADIRCYVEAELENNPDFVKKGLSQDLQHEIRDLLGDGASGMFRWASCQLNSLARCLSPKDIKLALKTLPRDLDETYRRMLENIPAEYKSHSIRLLQFLVHSKRPLSLAQAIDIIATEIDQEPRGFDPNGRLSLSDDILRYCPGMLTIVRAEICTNTWEILRLAHFSVKEYLLQQEQFNLERASIVIVRTSLAYLTDATDAADATDATHDREAFPLESYAATYWRKFAVSAGDSEECLAAINTFLQNERAVDRCQDLDEQDCKRDSIKDALSYVCHHGLLVPARYIIIKGADINARNGLALKVASYRGHLEIVQLLLDKGADLNRKGGLYGYALQAASASLFGNRSGVVRLLLTRGADVNATGGRYGNALQAATERGHLGVVQLLLDKGANVNADIVQLLLDRGVDVNVTGNYGNALYIALQKGFFNIVRLLLDKGADVNAGGESKNALYAASSMGHLEIVQLLLDKGADVNANGKDGTALHAASEKGFFHVVQVLLERGAEVNATSGEYRTALRAATSSENGLEIMRLLLDRGANVNASSSRSVKPLHIAVSRNDPEAVKLLLDRGAVVSQKMLQIASKKSPRIVQMLLASHNIETPTEKRTKKRTRSVHFGSRKRRRRL
ncbi:hypothetical protein FPOAC1_007010 [Fusarium poae]|uniref:hypothetical protein n=1 Tax=Fusarium poae TaxID=36050 RepID=UPI001CE7A031|nr:hypothetical protein FPOAC1_007010 [Fusarium poae]KAG8673694.1 hypothetical protein FPOAC1_007010 [Fusarium poae]